MLVTRRAGSNPVSGTLKAFLTFKERLFLFHPVLTYISFNFETMYNIENNRIKVSVSEKGAELQSFFDQETGIEYMWDANPSWYDCSADVFCHSGRQSGKYEFPAYG